MIQLLDDIEGVKHNKFVAELACYGGHLNRLIFLKSQSMLGRMMNTYVPDRIQATHVYMRRNREQLRVLSRHTIRRYSATSKSYRFDCQATELRY